MDQSRWTWRLRPSPSSSQPSASTAVAAAGTTTSSSAARSETPSPAWIGITSITTPDPTSSPMLTGTVVLPSTVAKDVTCVHVRLIHELAIRRDPLHRRARSLPSQTASTTGQWAGLIHLGPNISCGGVIADAEVAIVNATSDSTSSPNTPAVWTFSFVLPPQLQRAWTWAACHGDRKRIWFLDMRYRVVADIFTTSNTEQPALSVRNFYHFVPPAHDDFGTPVTQSASTDHPVIASSQTQNPSSTHDLNTDTTSTLSTNNDRDKTMVHEPTNSQSSTSNASSKTFSRRRTGMAFDRRANSVLQDKLPRQRKPRNTGSAGSGSGSTGGESTSGGETESATSGWARSLTHLGTRSVRTTRHERKNRDTNGKDERGIQKNTTSVRLNAEAYGRERDQIIESPESTSEWSSNYVDKGGTSNVAAAMSLRSISPQIRRVTQQVDDVIVTTTVQHPIRLGEETMAHVSVRTTTSVANINVVVMLSEILEVVDERGQTQVMVEHFHRLVQTEAGDGTSWRKMGKHNVLPTSGRLETRRDVLSASGTVGFLRISHRMLTVVQYDRRGMFGPVRNANGASSTGPAHDLWEVIGLGGEAGARLVYVPLFVVDAGCKADQLHRMGSTASRTLSTASVTSTVGSISTTGPIGGDVPGVPVWGSTAWVSAVGTKEARAAKRMPGWACDRDAGSAINALRRLAYSKMPRRVGGGNGSAASMSSMEAGERFPTFVVKEDTELAGQTCPVCLEGLGEARVMMLPCMHAGHASCFVRSQGRRMMCPVCRLDLRGFLNGERAMDVAGVVNLARDGEGREEDWNNVSQRENG